MTLEDLRSTVYVLKTPPCAQCGETGTVEVPAPGFFAYQLGALLQEAFPETPAPLREQIKSGYHPKCWTKLFGRHE